MAKPAHEFRIVTEWLVEASIDEVAAVLRDVESFPGWWGDVYLRIDVLERGDAEGMGGRVAVYSKGWLPYRLNWVGTLTNSRGAAGWSVEATGDLDGHGVWTLTQQGPFAAIAYDWRVLAEKPLLRALSPILAPVFAWNHRWAMARGEEGLKRELLRRRQVAG